MDEWFLPHTATGFACWDLTNSAVSLLTVYPKKPVPCGWFVLCTLTMTWFWQQSSLLHTVRSPQGALVDGSLCISQSFRHNLHQMRNSSGVWLINYFNLGEVFSFLEDLISLDQDLGSYGSMNIYMCDPSTWPSSVIWASPFQPRSPILSAFLCSCLCHWAWVFLVILHVALVPPSLPPLFLSAFFLFFDFGMNFMDTWQEPWLGWENPWH